VDTLDSAKVRDRTGVTQRKRRAFTPEFKADAVRLARASDRSIGQVAKELNLTERALRAWVKQAEIDASKGPPEALTTAERTLRCSAHAGTWAEQRSKWTKMAENLHGVVHVPFFPKKSS
jgi:transposase